MIYKYGSWRTRTQILANEVIELKPSEMNFYMETWKKERKKGLVFYFSNIDIFHSLYEY